MANSADLEKRYLQCVQDHADSMYRLAFRLTGRADLASDLVQETFTGAWQGMESLKEPEKMRSWMFSILRFQYTKMLRKIKKDQGFEYQDWSEVPEKDFDGDEKAHKQELLQAAIDQLEERFKLPLLLVSMEGYSVQQASEALGIPKGTILSRLHRARQQLKDKLMTKVEFSNE